MRSEIWTCQRAASGEPPLRALKPSVQPYRGGLQEGRGYDIGPKGEFVMVRTRRGSQRPEVQVVLSWFDELRRRAPAR